MTVRKEDYAEQYAAYCAEKESKERRLGTSELDSGCCIATGTSTTWSHSIESTRCRSRKKGNRDRRRMGEEVLNRLEGVVRSDTMSNSVGMCTLHIICKKNAIC